jgi:hypothetical protein
VGARRLHRLLELLGLTGLAVAEPILQAFGDDPATFIANRIDSQGVVVFALAVALLPALVLWAIELVVERIAPRTAATVHVGVVATLVAVIVLGWLHDLEVPAVVVYGLALAAAVGLVVVYRRRAGVGLWMRYLALAPGLFVLNFLFLAPTSGLIGSQAEAAPPGRTSGPPIVMVVLDELPLLSLLDEDGRVDELAYPNLARLAAESIWYRNHTTVADDTEGAVPALVTSQLPEPGELRLSYLEQPNTIFSLFEEDADLVAFEWVTDLCPPGRCVGDPANDTGLAAVTDLLDEVVRVFEYTHRPRAEVPDQDFRIPPGTGRPDAEFERFIDLLGEREQLPELAFLHVGLPHQPWRLLPDGDRYEAPTQTEGALTPGFVTEAAVVQSRLRHLAQVRATDRLVGQLRQRLQAAGTWDDAAVVLVADHGMAFDVDGPMRELTADNATEIAWAPLFIKLPGQTEGEVVDEPVRNIDVLPTIAGLLGVDIPWAEQGIDLNRERRSEDTFAIVNMDTGRSYEVDVTAGLREILAAAVVGGGDDADLRVFRGAPGGALVGRPVEALDGVEVGARFVDGPVVTYTPVEDSAPAYVDGTVDAPVGTPLVVTVNGRVGLVTEAQPGSGSARFWGLVPVSLLRPGENRLEVHRLAG